LAEKWADRFAYWHISLRRWHFVFPQVDMFCTPGLNRLWNSLAGKISLRRKFPAGMQPFYGGSYWCLTRESVEYVFEFVQQHSDFVNYFSKYVHIPDEIFFQTILLNSPFKVCLVNDDRRWIDFSKHGANPEILEKNDFKRLIHTEDLFARKFDMTMDREVLDMIDQAIS